MQNLIHRELKTVLDHSIQDTTSRFAGIQLQEQDVELSDDICTIHTIFEGGPILLLCADTALLTRLAQNIMHSSEVTWQDIEDVAKEYLNIICGQVVAGLFRTARITSRFRIPSFRAGLYMPAGQGTCQCELKYNGGHGGIRLICLCPSAPDPFHRA